MGVKLVLPFGMPLAKLSDRFDIGGDVLGTRSKHERTCSLYEVIPVS